ncbi:MAG TPA: hypothetical protein DCG54_10045 [Anaerolineae bacterium]|jgi:hypothetical protein|nr:hypothetical protein [Anaerolineae bacterium]
MSIIFVLINLALLPVFIFILKRFHLWVSFALLFTVTLETIFVAFYTLIGFGGAFGPGVLLFCASAVLTPVIFLALIIIGVRQFHQLNNSQKIVFTIGCIIILFAQLAPVIGDFGIGGYCDKKRMEFGEYLTTAIRQYHNDNGEYPSTIESLIPKYLPGKPVYNCMENLELKNDSFTARYEIMECGGKPSLVTYSTDGAREIWYDFETSKWASISFLDSECY